jgi:dTDP-4-dehydrorhamnose 3,5-epimerase
MIAGVKVKVLKLIPDERGFVMEILRNDDELFRQFGQCYLTAAYPGVVKAWHYHKLQTDHFCVVSGMAKVVLFDGRKDSPTQGRIDEFFIGERNRLLISIPPGVYHGYKNIGTAECLLLNIPTELYNYTTRMVGWTHSGEIAYDWSRRDG